MLSGYERKRGDSWLLLRLATPFAGNWQKNCDGIWFCPDMMFFWVSLEGGLLRKGLNCEKPDAERRSDGFEGEVQSTIKLSLVNYENFCNRLGSTFSIGNVTQSSFGTFLPFSYTNNSEFLHPLSRTFES